MTLDLKGLKKFAEALALWRMSLESFRADAWKKSGNNLVIKNNFTNNTGLWSLCCVRKLVNITNNIAT